MPSPRALQSYIYVYCMHGRVCQIVYAWFAYVYKLHLVLYEHYWFRKHSEMDILLKDRNISIVLLKYIVGIRNFSLVIRIVIWKARTDSSSMFDV